MVHDVVSIGNPLMDILIDVEEEFLKELGLVKGNMHLLNEEEIKKIEDKIDSDKVKLAPGGSAANTLSILSMLGHKVVFFGKVGKDDHGTTYSTKLKEKGVIFREIKVDGMTGKAITLITPDSERTFATHLGVATSLEDTEINEADIMEAKFLHVVTYTLAAEKTKKATLRALDIAKNNNVKICLDLSDPNMVKLNREAIESIIDEYVDIVIANENEAEEFTGLSAEEAVKALAKRCEIAIVKVGADGSFIKSKDELIKVKGFKVKAVDTTGAGDTYTAGFLYGLLNDLSLEVCGKIASFIASKVVQVKGAGMGKIDMEEIQNMIKND
jgi:sugar/nucleoside kinase (ribokinase family)